MNLVVLKCFCVQNYAFVLRFPSKDVISKLYQTCLNTFLVNHCFLVIIVELNTLLLNSMVFLLKSNLSKLDKSLKYLTLRCFSIQGLALKNLLIIYRHFSFLDLLFKILFDSLIALIHIKNR
jgi:hypothetical protein